MSNQFKSFIFALSTLSGTIIGVGLFTLPYITSKVGFWIILGYFAALSVIVILIHLLYAEVVMRTQGEHRLPGYAEIYLGRPGKILALMTMIFGIGGALFCYLVVGSGFLSSLLSPVLGDGSLFYLVIFFFLGASLIFFGIKSISKIEFFGLILFLTALLLIFFKGLPFIKMENLLTKVPVFDRPLFLPYGAILFALWGAALIPEITELMKNQLKNLRKLIPLAIIIPALVYLFFIFLVTGITGPATSKEAIIGLKNFLGNGIISLGLFFGVLTTFTSFITLGLTLKKVFWYDLKIPSNIAWLIACFGPLALYLVGFKDFIKIIGLVGGVMLGIEGIIIILVYLKAKIKSELQPAWQISLPKSLIYPLTIFLILGIIYEIFYFFK